MTEKRFTKEVVELIVKRLETVPPNIKMSVGSKGTFEIRDIIKSVEKQDEMGKMFIETQLQYLKSLKNLPA